MSGAGVSGAGVGGAGAGRAGAGGAEARGIDEKATLHRYLRRQRDDLLAKLDGLGEYDVRRPLVPTGTNLLGLVKHVGSVQLGYLGDVFGRPSGRPLPWFDDGAEPDADLWVPADESRADIVELFEFSCRHADATIEALTIDAVGQVPWWPAERRTVTLHQVLVHMTVETARHAGHADIVRELIDGAAGNGPGDANLTPRGTVEWAAHHARVEAAARAAGGGERGERHPCAVSQDETVHHDVRRGTKGMTAARVGA